MFALGLALKGFRVFVRQEFLASRLPEQNIFTQNFRERTKLRIGRGFTINVTNENTGICVNGLMCPFKCTHVFFTIFMLYNIHCLSKMYSSQTKLLKLCTCYTLSFVLMLLVQALKDTLRTCT